MKERGFSLVELMLVMLLFSIIMIASGTTFQRILFGVKSESKSVESNQEKLLGAELIRLDLEHTGFGIARDTPDLPIVWNESGASPAQVRQLTLRSTLNNSNQATIGWHVINCTTGSLISAQRVAWGGNVGQNTIVLLDENENFLANTTLNPGTCPSSGLYTAYPYDNTVVDGCAASGQFCNQVVYSLGGATPASCAPNTRNLIRTVGGGGGDPVINCVADMKVLFDLDTDLDGLVDIAGINVLPGGTSAIIDQVKNIDVYVLFQIGQREQNFTFSADTTLGGEIAFDTAGIANFTDYRWKVIKLSGRPMGWQ